MSMTEFSSHSKEPNSLLPPSVTVCSSQATGAKGRCLALSSAKTLLSLPTCLLNTSKFLALNI